MTRAEYLRKIDEIVAGAAGTENLPETAPVVAMFLRDFMPLDPPAESGDNMTSFEIVETLEDTCQLTTREVAAVMVHLGYRLFRNAYKGFEWAMTAAAAWTVDTSTPPHVIYCDTFIYIIVT